MSDKIPLDAIRHNLDLLRKAGAKEFLLGIAHAEALVRLAESVVKYLDAALAHEEMTTDDKEALEAAACREGSAYAEMYFNASHFLPGKEGA